MYAWGGFHLWETAMKTYRAVLVGCSRMGAFIDNEQRGASRFRQPYSHAAGYEACERTELVACSDLRPDVLEQAGKRYGVPSERLYTDYREMIDKEQPYIVSVATQPEQRAEVVIYAAEHGAKAVYAEKAMAASMNDARAMVEAVERNGVVFNLGTNRRWETAYDKMKELIDDGSIGDLQSLIIYGNGHLFNAASHSLDLALRLCGDVPVRWVQGNLAVPDSVFDGDTLTEDPGGEGIIRLENGVTIYALLSSQSGEFEAVGTLGRIKSVRDGREWDFRVADPADPDPRSLTYRRSFPDVPQRSSTLRLIEDIVHSLDTGEPPRGGVRVAYASTELIFGFIESHRRGGVRVPIPLKDSSTRLDRNKPARQPLFSPREA